MSELAVLVPVLARPHRVAPLLASFETATPGATILFIADPDDDAEITALERAGAEYVCHSGGYAAKINRGVGETSEPLIFLAADDLAPRRGWFEASRARLKGAVKVVGVNDLLDRSRNHATHFLVAREYAERGQIDGQPGLLHEGYSHWWVDDELIATATSRRAYAYAEDAHVEHLHPQGGKAPDDETYERGRAQRHRDRKRFLRRVPLWT